MRAADDRVPPPVALEDARAPEGPAAESSSSERLTAVGGGVEESTEMKAKGGEQGNLFGKFHSSHA